MKEDGPRWSFDCSLGGLIVFTAEVNYLREDIDRGEEVFG